MIKTQLHDPWKCPDGVYKFHLLHLDIWRFLYFINRDKHVITVALSYISTVHQGSSEVWKILNVRILNVEHHGVMLFQTKVRVSASNWGDTWLKWMWLQSHNFRVLGLRGEGGWLHDIFLNKIFNFPLFQSIQLPHEYRVFRSIMTNNDSL